MDKDEWQRIIGSVSTAAQEALSARNQVIRSARKSGIFSLRDLAALTGLSHQTIKNIERGGEP